MICVFISFAACKKNGNAPTPDKDYLSVLKDKGWSVTLSTSDNQTQYLFYWFNADGTMFISQTYGDFSKYTWKLDGKHLTMNMDATAFEGDITNDNKFVITKATPANPTPFVMAGELNTYTDLILDNSKWQGVATATGTTKTTGLALYFSPGLILDIPSPDPKIMTLNLSYTKTAGSFRAILKGATKNTYYFGIIMPGGKEIRGVIADAEGISYTFKVTKQ